MDQNQCRNEIRRRLDRFRPLLDEISSSGIFSRRCVAVPRTRAVVALREESGCIPALARVGRARAVP